MKKYKYFVYYTNLKEETFYCNGFQSAIILAMAYAIKNSWNIRIEYIINENGQKIKNIQLPIFTEEK